jgi:NO-binding membrane sensor protein with MHYT domain
MRVTHEPWLVVLSVAVAIQGDHVGLLLHRNAPHCSVHTL